MNRKPRRPTPHATFIASMEAFRLAHREHDIERNRERLRMQVFPLGQRLANTLILSEAALRERRSDANRARGNLLGHMLGYSRATESLGLPRWCDDVERWERRLLDHITVYRLPGTSGKPTIRGSFVTAEPYVSDEGSSSHQSGDAGLPLTGCA